MRYDDRYLSLGLISFRVVSCSVMFKKKKDITLKYTFALLSCYFSCLFLVYATFFCNISTGESSLVKENIL